MKLVKVRIAVAINKEGDLGSAISHDGDDASARVFSLELLGEESELEHVVFVEAMVPLPESATVEGVVVLSEHAKCKHCGLPRYLHDFTERGVLSSAPELAKSTPRCGSDPMAGVYEPEGS